MEKLEDERDIKRVEKLIYGVLHEYLTEENRVKKAKAAYKILGIFIKRKENV